MRRRDSGPSVGCSRRCAQSEAQGVEIVRGHGLEDVAVDSSGERLVVVGTHAGDPSALVHEIDRSGALVQTLRVPLETARSVAYDPAGGLLIGGTLTRTTYQVGRWFNGEYKKLLQSETDILSLVRPAHRRPAISILARTFSPELMKLPLLP